MPTTHTDEAGSLRRTWAKVATVLAVIGLADLFGQLIKQAHVIVVLGFGFHNQNIDLLKLEPHRTHQFGKTLFMTVMGIDEQNHQTIVERMHSALGYIDKVQIMP